MNNYRKQLSFNKRQQANELAKNRPHPRHYNNGDEQKFRHTKETAACHKSHDNEKEQHKQLPNIKGKPSFLLSFTKGMPHDKVTGLLKNPDHYQYFVKAIDSGDPRDFRDTPLGTEDNIGTVYQCKVPQWLSKKAKEGKDGNPVDVRAWESQSAGLAFDLEGPDSQAVTMPPAPRLGSDELTAELAEVYVQALLRDMPLSNFSTIDVNASEVFKVCKNQIKQIKTHTNNLNTLKWFSDNATLKLNLHEAARRCHRTCPTPASAFRGITPGDAVGPYLSQFLLVGNTGIHTNDNEHEVRDGYITYGAISIDQKVRIATPNVDYMTTWNEWLDVQHAARVNALETYEESPKRRFIYTPRDLATYVHYDALYEAYLNACLLLLAYNIPFDPGIPFQQNDNRDHQQGFAHFGGPHILSLVTEVATRALKAARFQKYNVHRRCRPEVLAARIHKFEELKDMSPELNIMFNDLDASCILNTVGTTNPSSGDGKSRNYLLPMAFCEGSPMHPSYGAGHATVAGACVTILKAFFDHHHTLDIVNKKHVSQPVKDFFKTKFGIKSEHINLHNLAYISVNEGKKLEAIPVLRQDNTIGKLTVEGELNKLASNISIGRNWAGVHYFSDYYESLLMGEQIAIGILEEQKLCFGENFSMTLPLFNGNTIRI